MCATEQVQVEEDIAAPRRESQVTAWVNAIYGCNEKCTYCVVPYTRCVCVCVCMGVRVCVGVGVGVCALGIQRVRVT